MSMDTIYKDGIYLQQHPSWHEEDSPWKAKQIATMLRRHNIVPSTVCEIGCGAGEILNCLAHEFGDGVVFSGYEISPQAFEICRKKEKHNLHFFLKDLLDEGEPRFDVVMAVDVVEHVEDYFVFLRGLKKRGTYKIFHIPLDLNVLGLIRGSLMEERLSSGHIQYFTKETALATLEETGYELLDYYYTKSIFDLPARSWKANLLNPLIKICFSIHQDFAVRLFGESLLVLAK